MDLFIQSTPIRLRTCNTEQKLNSMIYLVYPTNLKTDNTKNTNQTKCPNFSELGFYVLNENLSMNLNLVFDVNLFWYGLKIKIFLVCVLKLFIHLFKRLLLQKYILS